MSDRGPLEARMGLLSVVFGSSAGTRAFGADCSDRGWTNRHAAHPRVPNQPTPTPVDNYSRAV